VTTGDQKIHLSVTLKTFGAAEVRLFRWRGVESGVRVRPGDLGAPVDSIAQTLRVAEVQIFHRCSVESEGMKIGD